MIFTQYTLKLPIIIYVFFILTSCTNTENDKKQLIYIKSKSSGTYIEVLNKSLQDKERIVANEFNESISQQWYLEKIDSNVYCLKSRLSGLAIDCKNGSKDRHSLLLQYKYCGNDNQKIQLISKGDYYQFIFLHSGMAIEIPYGSDDNNVCLFQNLVSGADNQLWSLIPVDKVKR